MISVIIPTWNDGPVLGRCLNSVFNQTFKDFEVIVVNDASTDNTLEVLEPYLDRITLINNPPNLARNPNPTRMRGFQEAKGKFLLFLDSDIEMQPNMLELLYKALETHPRAAYAYGSFKFGFKEFKAFPFNPERLRQMNYIHTSALIRREDFPGFDPKIKKFQDWDVWLTMLGQGKQGVFVNQVIFKAAVDDHSISNWMPKIAYKIPWRLIGWKPEAIRKYEEAREVIRRKHKL